MSRRTRHNCLKISLLLLLSAWASAAEDEGDFSCHVSYNGLKYDLTKIKGQQVVKRTRETPPSTMIDTVVFDLCEGLQPDEGVDEKDQCPSGTRACLTKTNRKEGSDDRIVAVIPLASSPLTDVQYSELSSPKGLSVSFKGSTYPPPNGDDPIPQTFNVNLICDPDAVDLEFSSYDGRDMWVEWRTSAGCGFGGPGEPPETHPSEDTDKDEKSVGSGIGYFFLLLFLALIGYFGLGAYYNYSTYGASGLDLIPHRDFWREVPYMLRDVVSHLCSAVRPHSASRGGYIAV
ncbi:hypothetical protein POSPLADRAFT_1132639 [Postia placenta MAD-698-R-SB12]|uniref:Autophagy-related protein 27 n=1 Tax=Postia placenta MAD-698-R-SB12 TaxID=670580 RepID=A0A1X6NC72_9APHY|nr:hypothetical protein POSPLADRAFT_1132639 [Postia placenta MAD-698-R-SB12]OSX66201.1 hypothetical protein POSPLADRAFT_1132639 [Postia placenta MAD-698-R-SB12]